MNHNIFIGTPCFEFKVNANYTKTLLEFAKIGINFDPFFVHDSLITRSRNHLITLFYENKEKYSHLLWLDSDVSIPAKGIETLLSHNVDVIAAPVPIKDLTLKQSIREVYSKVSPYVYKARASATGCLLMSKKSVIALIENSSHYFDNDGARKVYNVFEVGIKDGEYMSEDWDICYKLNDMNFEIYIDSSFTVAHSGIYDYIRNPMQNEETSCVKISYS